nr:hypothetical protein [Candidatus Njordarchaeota archaeon]
MSYDNLSYRPVLYDYFKDSADVLLAEYNRSKGQESTTNVGSNREMFCNMFLRHVLPPRLRVSNGEIMDSDGKTSNQLDIIVIRDDCPSLHYGKSNTFLVEGVFAVIEVKSNLTTAELRDSMEKLKRVGSLTATGSTLVQSSPHKFDQIVFNRPLRYVFAYESATWETLTKELVKTENSDVADMICVLNRGALFPRPSLDGFGTGKPFPIYHGRAASLGLLYYHLVSRAIIFVEHSISLDSYFKSPDSWSDDTASSRKPRTSQQKRRQKVDL